MYSLLCRGGREGASRTVGLAAKWAVSRSCGTRTGAGRTVSAPGLGSCGPVWGCPAGLSPLTTLGSGYRRHSSSRNSLPRAEGPAPGSSLTSSPPPWKTEALLHLPPAPHPAHGRGVAFSLLHLGRRPLERHWDLCDRYVVPRTRRNTITLRQKQWLRPCASEKDFGWGVFS